VRVLAWTSADASADALGRCHRVARGSWQGLIGYIGYGPQKDNNMSNLHEITWVRTPWGVLHFNMFSIEQIGDLI